MVLSLITGAQIMAQDNSPKPVEKVMNDVIGINFSTVETARKGDMGFFIVHRFGTVDGGYQDFFGLDNNANWRLGFDYGITPKMTVGIGRNSHEKLHDVLVKYKMLQQNDQNTPFTATAQFRTGLNGTKFSDDEKEYLNFEHRLSYSYTLMAARQFNIAWSAQLSAMAIHNNLIKSPDQENTIYAAGATLKYAIRGGFSVMGEYFHNLSYHTSSDENYFGNIALGFDYSTYGHNFSLFFTNSALVTETQSLLYNWGSPKSETLRVGFNITRKFRI